MRLLHRVSGIVASLAVVVSTMTGATMSCALGGGGPLVAGAPIPAHSLHHAAPAAADAQHEHGGGHAATEAASSQSDAPPDDAADPHGATCAATGPCALVLLGAPSSARFAAGRPAVVVAAASDLRPPSQTAVPDLPPPKA